MIGSIFLQLSLSAFCSGALAAELPGEGALGGGSLQVTDDLDFRYYHYPPEQQLPGFEDRLVQDYVEQVNRLNLLAAVFLPLTALASVFGMEIHSQIRDSPVNFWMICAFGLLLGTVLGGASDAPFDARYSSARVTSPIIRS